MRRKRFLKELKQMVGLFVSCEKCVCLLKKMDAHEVISLGWSGKKYVDDRTNIPEEGMDTGFEMFYGYAYKMPTTIRKYYCKKCKPKEKEKGKK